MRVTLPHELGRDEVKRRLHDHAHEIADYFPGNMATVTTDWPQDYVMGLTVSVVGQNVGGVIETYDDHVVIDIDVPRALSFLKGTIESSLKKEATRLLEKK